jgi:hypothetical protein
MELTIDIIDKNAMYLLSLNLTLLTRNIDDFKNISSLSYLNPLGIKRGCP